VVFARDLGVLDQRSVFGSYPLRHPRSKLTLLPRGGELADPDRRLAARFDDLISEPLHLLAVPRVERQRRQSVQ
jgi:hypothetical protein